MRGVTNATRIPYPSQNTDVTLQGVGILFSISVFLLDYNIPELVDHFICLGSHISSTESRGSIYIDKSWTAFDHIEI